MKTLLLASTGKDSVWALHQLHQTPGVEVVGMLTTRGKVTHEVPFQRASRALIQAQARALWVEVMIVDLPGDPCSPSEYESALNMATEEAKLELGVDSVAFAHAYKGDLQEYREKFFTRLGYHVLWPLAGQSTRELAHEMLAAGLKAKITVVRKGGVDPKWVGQDFSEEFLASMPPEIDPCGERGGFRTFAYDGPMFKQPLAVEIGPPQELGNYHFVELELAKAPVEA